MELSQLEVFLAVAREHRFSRAAEKLYRTQSAVSQTIRKLEDELGESLFDRSSREGILTDAGQVLFEYAEKLLNLRHDAHVSLAELRELQKGKLVIGANEFTALYLLPVLATILGILMLGEKGSWMELVGGGLALGGVYWTESSRASRLATNGSVR